MEVEKIRSEWFDCRLCGDENIHGYRVGNICVCPECAFKSGWIDGDEYMHYIYEIPPKQRWRYRVVLHDGQIFWGKKNTKFDFELTDKERKQREMVRFRQSPEYKVWRETVILNRGAKCARCGRTDSLQVHHIIPISVCEKYALEPLNGIVLCSSCHAKIHVTDDPKWVFNKERYEELCEQSKRWLQIIKETSGG